MVKGRKKRNVAENQACHKKQTGMGYVKYFMPETRLEENENMNFGKALEAIKNGKKAKRKGWNGKEQYIELAQNISYQNMGGEIVNCNHENIGNKAIAFVGTSGVQMGWLASQADMLADDWEIVE